MCVSVAEDDWRAENISGYLKGSAALLSVTYLGVWDTVGSLGVPERYKWLNWTNQRHQFHDTKLSSFVKNARHAVAIDEHRRDFAPTLWSNIDTLNEGVAKTSADPEAPYQQQWFPGTHGSVGGGGNLRGLSDQALDWVLDGARRCGLDLDIAPGSRIFELGPDYRERLNNSSSDPGVASWVMHIRASDRKPGPLSLHEVSRSTQRRWHEVAEKLPERSLYRPETSSDVAAALDAVDSRSLGIGFEPPTNVELHVIQQGETLSGIAHKVYGDAKLWHRIHEANLDTIDNPNRIYAGKVLRIPLCGGLLEAEP